MGEGQISWWCNAQASKVAQLQYRRLLNLLVWIKIYLSCAISGLNNRFVNESIPTVAKLSGEHQTRQLLRVAKMIKYMHVRVHVSYVNYKFIM